MPIGSDISAAVPAAIVPPPQSPPPWGTISGTLSDQLDLQSALDAKASTSYVDNAVLGLLDFKGSQDCSSNPNYPSALKGDVYMVSVAGKIGGASGVTVEAGDLFTATLDNAGGTQASVGGSWVITERNIVFGTGVSTALGIAANTTGGVLTYGGAGAHTTLTATSLNGNTFTTGTYTLTGAAGKTLTFSNTLTLAGTDSASLNIGAGGTLGTAAFSASSFFAASGANSDITSLSGITAATGGASNMTITSGTGNSRTLILRTTTSVGTATTALTLNADQSATFAAGLTIAGNINSTTNTIIGAGQCYLKCSGDILTELYANNTQMIACRGNLGYIDVPAQLRGNGGILASGKSAAVGGTIFSSFADTSTTHTDGTEDDLYSYTIAASILGSNGEEVNQEETMEFTSSATASRRVKKYFGGTLIFDSGALTPGLGTFDMVINTQILRESSTVVRCTVSIKSSTTVFSAPLYTRITGLTLSNTQVLKTTGIASGTGAASGDITNKQSKVKWMP